MKKVVFVVMAMALLTFASCAFATEGGHVTPIVPVQTDTTYYQNVTVETHSENVLTASGIDKDDVASKTNNSKFELTDAAKYPTLYGGATITLDNVQATSGNITLQMEGFTKTPVYAWVKATDGTFVKYPYDSSTGQITGVDYSKCSTPDVDVFFGSEASSSTGGGGGDASSSGGGGCNAGFAALVLLAAVPLCFFRKK